MPECNNRQPCAMCHQQTTGTSSAAKSHQCTHRGVVEDMDWTAQIKRLSCGPVWQFLVQTCQEKQPTTTRYVPPTENWHIYCSKITPVYTQVDGRGHGLACLNFPTVLWAHLVVDLAVFGADLSGKNNQQPRAMSHEQRTGTSTAANSNPCSQPQVDR